MYVIFVNLHSSSREDIVLTHPTSVSELSEVRLVMGFIPDVWIGQDSPGRCASSTPSVAQTCPFWKSPLAAS